MRNIIDRIENSVLKIIVTIFLMIFSFIAGLLTWEWINKILLKHNMLKYKNDEVTIKM